MPPRVLYAEDHDDTRELVSLLLRRGGFEVVEAASGSEFMSRLAGGGHFDLYLLDHSFPDASGVELCRATRERDPAAPILFYSGRALPKEREEALGAGASEYLVKPGDLFNVAEYAARWVGRGRS